MRRNQSEAELHFQRDVIHNSFTKDDTRIC